MVYFQNQKYQFGYILEGLRLENVNIFYGNLEYFIDIWDILRPFGIFCVHLVHLFRFWYHVPGRIWQPRFRDQFLLVFAVDMSSASND
jgi:hypothetical protein